MVSARAHTNRTKVATESLLIKHCSENVRMGNGVFMAYVFDVIVIFTCKYLLWPRYALVLFVFAYRMHRTEFSRWKSSVACILCTCSRICDILSVYLLRSFTLNACFVFKFATERVRIVFLEEIRHLKETSFYILQL